MKANEIGIIGTAHEITSSIVRCTEQGRNCQNLFIPTRVGQKNICLKCLLMLEGELPEIKKCKGDKLVL